MKFVYVHKDELYKEAMDLYKQYRCGLLSYKKYLFLIKPIDMQIGDIEMFIFQEKLVFKTTFLSQVPKKTP